MMRLVYNDLIQIELLEENNSYKIRFFLRDQHYLQRKRFEALYAVRDAIIRNIPGEKSSFGFEENGDTISDGIEDDSDGFPRLKYLYSDITLDCSSVENEAVLAGLRAFVNEHQEQ